MIIVSSYPELDDSDKSASQLQQLRQLVENLLPPEVILHILPPYPASGDGGFAANEWFSTRSELGSWNDFIEWSSSRKLILDGIYNHVGQEHSWVADFFANPSDNGPIYAYKGKAPPSSQLSPRGGSVFREYIINDNNWFVWQTFSKVSFDIRISLPCVLTEIRRHLHFLSDSGIYGVRLDGCAYYGHDLGIEQFHNPSGRKMTQFLAREAQDTNLFVMAQLDADPSGASYFLKEEGWSVPVVDYAYSAVLILAILSESASHMEKHVKRILKFPCEFICPPRTHDGILLQSDLLTDGEILLIEDLCEYWDLPIRIVEGESYEINSSLPFICSLGVDKQDAWQRILLVVALTGFLPGIPYFYLPFILCDIPETRNIEFDNDPRSLNRARLRASYISDFSRSKNSKQMYSLLQAIDRIRELHLGGEFKTIVPSLKHTNSVLIITRDDERCFFACNFSIQHTVELQLPKAMKLDYGSRFSDTRLGPLGFGFWRKQ